jgi:cytidyltransferase-like protein
LCHIGHKNVLREASKFGDLLVVGVINDEDCFKAYHERPIMSQSERCAELMALPFVHKVIRDSPINGITKEFLLEHNIDVCIQPWEYDIENKVFAAEVAKGNAIDFYKGKYSLYCTLLKITM